MISPDYVMVDFCREQGDVAVDFWVWEEQFEGTVFRDAVVTVSVVINADPDERSLEGR